MTGNSGAPVVYNTPAGAYNILIHASSSIDSKDIWISLSSELDHGHVN